MIEKDLNEIFRELDRLGVECFIHSRNIAASQYVSAQTKYTVTLTAKQGEGASINVSAEGGTIFHTMREVYANLNRLLTALEAKPQNSDVDDEIPF